ncbi:MAG: hypothetical protein V2I33_22050, partial [Kangiellaceae bacterium]|nr:hypothetical protein [Kangiellaceae bacterium]
MPDLPTIFPVKVDAVIVLETLVLVKYRAAPRLLALLPVKVQLLNVVYEFYSIRTAPPLAELFSRNWHPVHDNSECDLRYMAPPAES